MADSKLPDKQKRQQPAANPAKASESTDNFEALARSMQNTFMMTPGSNIYLHQPRPGDIPSAEEQISFIQRSADKQPPASAQHANDSPSASATRIRRHIPVTPLKPPGKKPMVVPRGLSKGSSNGSGANDLPETLNVSAPEPAKKFRQPMTVAADLPDYPKGDAKIFPCAETINMDFEGMARDVDSDRSLQKTLDIDFSQGSSNIGMQATIASTETSENEDITPSSVPSNSGERDPYQLLSKTLVRKYEIVGFLGQGGMGAVYLARHSVLKKKRALKFLPKSEALDPTAVRRFLQEARVAAGIEHPNIVQVYDVEETDRFYFLVMEYVKGQGLDSFSEQHGPLSSYSDIVKIIKPAALGLAAIHSYGMVHRDIKPANLMLSESGQVKITDFGIVKELSANTALTNTATILGTPQFMSPEQIKAHGIDSRSDIYSLGATFYYLVTKQLSFNGTMMQLMYKILNEPPLPPHELNPALSPDLAGMILRMMEKEPEDRYQTMHEVVTALENCRA